MVLIIRNIKPDIERYSMLEENKSFQCDPPLRMN